MPNSDPMPVDEAVQVLRGVVPYPIIQDDMDRATVTVLAEIERLRSIERAAHQCVKYYGHAGTMDQLRERLR